MKEGCTKMIPKHLYNIKFASKTLDHESLVYRQIEPPSMCRPTPQQQSPPLFAFFLFSGVLGGQTNRTMRRQKQVSSKAGSLFSEEGRRGAEAPSVPRGGPRNRLETWLAGHTAARPQVNARPICELFRPQTGVGSGPSLSFPRPPPPFGPLGPRPDRTSS